MGLVQLIGTPFSTVWRAITFKGAAVTTEVSASIPIIEILERQIHDAVKKGTSATDQLSSSFGEMATRAREVVGRAADAQRDDSDAGVDQVRDLVSELLTQVRQTCNSTQQMAEMLSEIESDLQDVEHCISQIEEIANRSRMVSLNGQIEAARAQEHGDGFAVVASETGDLASNVSETSKRIREVVDRMSKSLHRTAEETHRLVKADQEATAQCEQRVEVMLSSLADYQNKLVENLDSTKTSSDQLAGAISQAVMTLQFQDAISQRMHHVIEAMSEMRESFSSVVGQPSRAAERLRDQRIAKIESKYCVDDERLVLTGQAAANVEPSQTSNVELF